MCLNAWLVESGTMKRHGLVGVTLLEKYVIVQAGFGVSMLKIHQL